MITMMNHEDEYFYREQVLGEMSRAELEDRCVELYDEVLRLRALIIDEAAELFLSGESISDEHRDTLVP